MSGVRGGGMAALDAFIAALDRVAQDGPAAVSDAITDVAADQIADGFAGGHAPDGSGWAPTKAGNPPLHGTGALAAAARPVSNGRGLSVSVSVPYAGFHMTGTRRMPARPFLPQGELPGAWEQAMNEAALDALQRFFPR
jgi:phage gpG-like protein